MQKNWTQFYMSGAAPDEPSSFARFVMNLNLPCSTAVDLGSGNGRDTRLLCERYITTGVEPAILKSENPKPKLYFFHGNWQHAKKIIQSSDLVYSRFFLHSVPWNEVLDIIDLTTGYFCAEARAAGDEPKLYPEHERHYVDGKKIYDALGLRGFEILHYEKRRGLAPYKNEDPLLVRVIAKRI